METWYCTREDIKSALGSALTARDDAQVDRAALSAVASVDALTHRTFAPWVGTRTFVRPLLRSGVLTLGQPELVTLAGASAGGQAVTGAAGKSWDGQAPYDQLDLAGAAGYRGGDLALTGTFGYRDDSAPAGILAGAVTSVAIVWQTSAAPGVGVGSLLRVDDERVLVLARNAVTTAQTLQAGAASSAAAVGLAVTDGTAFVVGETLLIDTERVLVQDIAGNTLVVKRAYDGSVLAAHNVGATVYALRLLTVQRASAGTTAAAHSGGAAITAWQPPGLIRSLAVAEALQQTQQEQSGYARDSGSPDRSRPTAAFGLDGLRMQVQSRYGRQARLRSV